MIHTFIKTQMCQSELLQLLLFYKHNTLQRSQKKASFYYYLDLLSQQIFAVIIQHFFCLTTCFFPMTDGSGGRVVNHSNTASLSCLMPLQSLNNFTARLCLPFSKVGKDFPISQLCTNLFQLTKQFDMQPESLTLHQHHLLRRNVTKLPLYLG